MNIPQHIFRAYDIRGIAYEELSPDCAQQVGLALGTYAQLQGESQFVVARDGRLSSPEISAALIDGLKQTGINIIDIGMVPTPLLYFATEILDANAGAMVTGSHNPGNYNGIKIVINNKTLARHEIADLYTRIIQQDYQYGEGDYQQIDIKDNYIQVVQEKIKLPRPLKVVIDCGNGIAGVIAPALFRTLNAEVITLFCEVDGHFPNHHPDPSEPENLNDLIQAVNKHKADIGLAFDGDADRLGLVTNQGEIIFPDRQMMLFACEILSRKPKSKIVYDVKCSANLAKVIQANGGVPILSETGHSLVKAKLRQTQAELAGELSGHLFFKDRWYGFDDGLYAGARILEILANTQQSISALFAALPNSPSTPELKIFIDEDKKFAFMQQLQRQAQFPGANIITLDGLRVEYPNGWGLIRASNTSPCLVTRFEGDSEQAISDIQEKFRKAIKNLNQSISLPF